MSQAESMSEGVEVMTGHVAHIARRLLSWAPDGTSQEMWPPMDGLLIEDI